MKNSKLRTKFIDVVYAIGLRPLREDADLPYQLAVLPSLRYWYADPIVAEINGKEYLFAEAFDRLRQKGFIAAFDLEVTQDGVQCSKPRNVLEEDFHLSFPVIFQHDGQYYMMPESSADQSLRIYRMGSTPYEWQLARRIPMENSVDTVIIPAEEGVYFLNTQEHPVETLKGKQRLYFTRDILNGELEDCTDCLAEQDYMLTKRNGGPVYEKNGQRIRVCQNSVGEFYGVSYSEYRIQELSPEQYREEFVRTVNPEDHNIAPWSADLEIFGTHTYSRTAKVEAIDVSCYYCSVDNILPKVLRKLPQKK